MSPAGRARRPKSQSSSTGYGLSFLENSDGADLDGGFLWILLHLPADQVGESFPSSDHPTVRTFH